MSTEGAHPLLLERLIENLQVEVNPFAVCEVSHGWRLRLSGTPWVTIHYILEGEGILRFADREPVPIRPRTLVVMPVGLLHILDHSEGSTREESGDCGPRSDGLLQFIAGPDGDRDIQILCGRLSATYGGTIDVFGHLADPLVLDFAEDPAMGQIFDRLIHEQRNPTIGSPTVCSALMDECVVHILRAMCNQPDTDLTWLAAVEDPLLAPALDRILERPQDPHTVESLAVSAAMSRSTFAERFSAAFGRSPINYVREVRLRKAADILRTTDRSIDEIASRVGFASRSHFSRAFRELFGESPTAFRSHAAAQ